MMLYLVYVAYAPAVEVTARELHLDWTESLCWDLGRDIDPNVAIGRALCRADFSINQKRSVR